jgi:hypothetical protein
LSNKRGKRKNKLSRGDLSPLNNNFFRAVGHDPTSLNVIISRFKNMKALVLHVPRSPGIIVKRPHRDPRSQPDIKIYIPIASRIIGVFSEKVVHRVEFCPFELPLIIKGIHGV